MRPYFAKMDDLGKPLRPAQMERMKENAAQAEAVMKEIDAEDRADQERGHSGGEGPRAGRDDGLGPDRVPGRSRGRSARSTRSTTRRTRSRGARGWWTAWRGSRGKWCVLIGFNNKWIAGAWIAGQAENNLRVTDLAKIMNLPLVWLVNCSGVKLPEQEKVYANRRGQGTCFFRHAELEQMGIPVLAGIYGTNPAGGGYQGISPTILLAHKNANIAVGGGGIVSGMSPKGYFDEAGRRGADRGDAPLQGGPPGEREGPLRLHGVLHGRFRKGDRGPRRAEGVHGGDARLQPAVFPGGGACGAEVLPGGDRLDRPDESEGGLRFRQRPGAAGGQLGAPGVPSGLRPGGLYGPGEGGRVPDGGDREPAGTPAELPGVHQRIHRGGRQALPAGAHQDERVRDAVRPGPGPDHLAPGHIGDRRGGYGGEGGAAGAGAVADLFDRADESADDAGGPAEGDGGGPLRDGRARRRTTTTPSRWGRRRRRST